MYGWVAGTTDRWTGGWVGGWMDGWMDGWVDGWMGGWIFFAFGEKKIKSCPPEKSPPYFFVRHDFRPKKMGGTFLVGSWQSHVFPNDWDEFEKE